MEAKGHFTSPVKGSGPKKLGASSYLLELLPDSASGGVSEVFRHRMHIEGFPAHYQLAGRQDDPLFRHQEPRPPDPAAIQTMQWQEKTRDNFLRHFPSSTKHRLSRTKLRLQGTEPATVTPSESTTHLRDHVIFTESPVAPGVPVVVRPPEDREVNPERLNLDRKHLMVCPILEGEERLRLLNLQHNSIGRLQHLNNLRRLVFLDLYDNLVQEITGLDGLVSLRVLMLGRNRIRKISGLQALIKLDVLDLHGNTIREIECLDHLSHLRVLNLAGNNITCVSGLARLQALAELNLRRNRITNVYEMDVLANLQRLFLSHNLIQSFDDAPCLTNCDSLTDLSLDGNPLANATDHRQTVLYRINQLRMLDQTPVSDKERQEAWAVTREEEERKREQKKMSLLEERKETAISAIRSQWEVTHQLSLSDLSSSSYPSLSSQVSSHPMGVCTISRAQHSTLGCASLPHLLPTIVPTHFLELQDATLHLYGQGALEAMETSAPMHSKQPIQEMHFSYLEFEDIAQWLPKLGLICPNVTSLIFDYANMSGLDQLNALAQLTTPLHSLTVSSHGNPITRHPLFSMYALYRLSHLGLSLLDGEAVKDQDLVQAEQMFGRLSQLTTSHLPQARLLALITKYRSRGGGRKLPLAVKSAMPTCSEPVNRVGLHHFSAHSAPPSSVAQQDRVITARTFGSSLLSSVLLTHDKVTTFERVWPTVLAALVHSTVEEYANIDQNTRTLLDDL